MTGFLATGEAHTVRDFLKIAFDYFSLNWEDYVLTSDRYIIGQMKLIIY